MKRSVFFLIAAITAGLFGAMMFFVPDKAAEGFGLHATPETQILFRALGGMILASGCMNFLVRHHEDNITLKAVLLTNVITHLLSMIADMWGVADGVLEFSKAAPGQIAHLFVLICSMIYLVRMKGTANVSH